MAESNPLRVLIADDEPLAAERLQLLLARAEGAQLVGTASDGDSARSMVSARSVRPVMTREDSEFNVLNRKCGLT
jgi:YesN/AraC family two-component response regulator